MYYDDHNPPHFHALYGDEEAQIVIETLEVRAGGLPNRAFALVLEWAAAHRTELSDNWVKARDGLPLQPIEPLK